MVINIRRSAIILFLIFIVYVLFCYISLPFATNDLRPEVQLLNKSSLHHWFICSSNAQLHQCPIPYEEKISVIFIGDHKYSIPLSKKTNIIFLNSHLQSKLGFRSKDPRIVAYLFAIKHGARFIYTFNSNISFHYHQNIQHIAFRRQRSPFINIYPTFTANFTHVSPGLPNDELKNITEDGWSSIRTIDQHQESIHPLIQQQILIYGEKQSSLVNHPPVAVEPFTFAPFTSQNIIFTYNAFWGLVLPESKSDTWRSWWVQRLLWDIDGHIVFASTAHETNTTITAHYIQNAKEDENVGKLVRFLSTWKSTKTTLVERIEQLINDAIKHNFCDKEELNVIRAWIHDLQEIKYVFPSTNSKISQPTTLRRRRTAVCLTGLVECIEEAWRPTAHAIQTHIKGDMDVFMYLSSTEPIVEQLPTISLHNRLIEVLQYSNFTVKVLFENIPKLDPHFPPNCTTDNSVDQPAFKIPRYYQQLFGLSNCFNLVRDYEKKHNIKYDLMVRTRADIEFLKIPSTFDRGSPYDINTTLILPPNRYASKVDDGFAIGPIGAVEVYMNRYFSFQECLTRDLHPERYLYFYLNYRKVNMTIDGNTIVGHIPHSSKHCH